MDTNETYQFEDRVYVNPSTAQNEAESFITTLRETQQGNNAQIEQDTQMLGTDVPSSQGGLISGASNPDSYFASRYQTPQVNSQVANLRATTQAATLNQLLKNDAAQWQKRYKDAYLAYQKRMHDKSNANAGGNQSNGPQTPGNVNENPNDVKPAENNGGVLKPSVGGTLTIVDPVTGVRKTLDATNNQVIAINEDYTDYGLQWLKNNGYEKPQGSWTPGGSAQQGNNGGGGW